MNSVRPNEIQKTPRIPPISIYLMVSNQNKLARKVETDYVARIISDGNLVYFIPCKGAFSFGFKRDHEFRGRKPLAHQDHEAGKYSFDRSNASLVKIPGPSERR